MNIESEIRALLDYGAESVLAKDIKCADAPLCSRRLRIRCCGSAAIARFLSILAIGAVSIG